MNWFDEEEEKKDGLTEEQKAEVYGSLDKKYGPQLPTERESLEARVESSAPAGWRKALMAAGGGDVSSLYEDQNQARKSLKDFDEKQDLKRADAQRLADQDPNSEESRTMQALAAKMMPGRDFSKVPASKLKASMPTLEKMYTVEQNRLTRNDSLKAAADAKAEALREKLEEKKIRQREQDTQKLSKDVTGVQGSLLALDDVENELGFTLDEAEAEDGVVKVGGKEKDLPGVSIPLVGRVSAYSEKARNLKSAASKVFNAVLKDRSGSAVTNHELERLKSEFNEGKFNTEAEMVKALKRYKVGVAAELKNREAAYNPEVVDTYTDQGGRTSKTIKATGSQPQTKVVDGVTYRKVPGGWEEVENAQVSVR